MPISVTLFSSSGPDRGSPFREEAAGNYRFTSVSYTHLSKVVRRIPDPEEEDTDSSEENTSETASGASAPMTEKTVVGTQTTTVKEPSGFRRKKITLPDFERTFFAPVNCRNRSAIYVSAHTKHKVSEILHLLGNESTRLTALVDNMLRFVMDIYSDELNYLHEKKNNRRPF